MVNNTMVSHSKVKNKNKNIQQGKKGATINKYERPSTDLAHRWVLRRLSGSEDSLSSKEGYRVRKFSYGKNSDWLSSWPGSCLLMGK